jgi:hypothetical protein
MTRSLEVNSATNHSDQYAETKTSAATRGWLVIHFDFFE